MMNTGILFAASIVAFPVSLIVIAITIIYDAIMEYRENKRFEAAVNQCNEENGWDFTRSLLDRCAEKCLPIINRIELLEHFAGGKSVYLAIAERTSRV